MYWGSWDCGRVSGFCCGFLLHFFPLFLLFFFSSFGCIFFGGGSDSYIATESRLTALLSCPGVMMVTVDRDVMVSEVVEASLRNQAPLGGKNRLPGHSVDSLL